MRSKVYNVPIMLIFLADYAPFVDSFASPFFTITLKCDILYLNCNAGVILQVLYVLW
jgi:hypothetical protein